VRNKIEVLIPDASEDDLAGLPKEVVMAVRQYRMMVSNDLAFSQDSFNLAVAAWPEHLQQWHTMQLWCDFV
jgi:hypothetical protein